MYDEILGDEDSDEAAALAEWHAVWLPQWGGLLPAAPHPAGAGDLRPRLGWRPLLPMPRILG